MKIVEIRPIEGANIYCHRPVIRLRLDLEEYAGVLTNELPDFIGRLLLHLPSLNEHHCSKGRPGGFIERLQEGTLIGHVIEHVALELQHLAGMDVVYGKTVQAEAAGTYYIVNEYESKEGGIQALRAAIKLVKAYLEKHDVSTEPEIKLIRELADRYSLGPSTKAITHEAMKKGIPIMRLGEGSILQLGYGKYQQKVEATITGKTKCIGVDIAGDKVLVKQLLAESGIPVPLGGVARTVKEALEIATKIGEAVAVKPFDGNQGKGVALNLTEQQEIARAFDVALSFSPKAIIEKFIKGKQYRLVVVGERVVAASERIPAFVVGDGHSSIKKLVEIVNADPLRGKEHEKPLTKINIDAVVLMVLAKKGFVPDSVPDEGQIVYLRENANISTGGIAVDVTGRVHKDTVQLVLRAVRLIGLDVAGVDLVVSDINQKLTPDNGAIIEINAAPGIRMHHYPAKGKPRNVAGAIVEMLFPYGAKSRIPIVSVTGTNGKTTVTRLISHILQITGSVVGMTSTEGIYINKTKIVSGDTTGPHSAQVVLREPSVEVAVFETARGGILRAGLGYDYSNVGIVTNISNDHLGLDGIETLDDMVYVKAVVLEAVHKTGHAVLNADDPYTAKLIKRVSSSVVYFSMAEDNLIVRRHLGFGGTAVFIKNKTVVVASGTKLQKILPVKHTPCGFGGLVQHNMQNVLAAVAGCIALKTDVESIREGLLSFTSSEKCNPGRFNLFEMGAFRVVVDYGHNEAGYIGTLQAIQKLKPNRIIGVVCMPGDRKNEDIIKVGQIVSKYCDQIIVKEDSNLRGRTVGEVANLLTHSIVESGTRRERIEIVLPELAALEKGLNLATVGDVVVVFYEKLDPILQLIRQKSDQLAAKNLIDSEDIQFICGSTG